MQRCVYLKCAAAFSGASFLCKSIADKFLCFFMALIEDNARRTYLIKEGY